MVVELEYLSFVGGVLVVYCLVVERSFVVEVDEDVEKKKEEANRGGYIGISYQGR